MHSAMVLHMANHPPTPDLVGTAEVCRLLRINQATVGRMAADGRLKPVHKLPGKNGAYLFARADVDRLIAERADASA